MNLLLVAATRQEIAPLLDKTGVGDGITTRYKNNSIDVLITGVGMVATAYQLGKALTGEYDLAMNLGIAGSFNRNLKIGEVVNVYTDRFSELGAEDDSGFLTLEEMNLPGQSEIINTASFSNPFIDTIPKVTGITVNTVHGNERSIETVFNRFHPYVESMEGAAFLFACSEAKIPCVQLRAISNYVEKRNKGAWNIPLAIENLNKKAFEIIESLSSKH